MGLRPPRATHAGMCLEQPTASDTCNTPHPHCTHTHILTHMAQACQEMDPTLIPLFIKTCRPLGLNGVHQPFWKSWGQVFHHGWGQTQLVHLFISVMSQHMPLATQGVQTQTVHRSGTSED